MWGHWAGVALLLSPAAWCQNGPPREQAGDAAPVTRAYPDPPLPEPQLTEDDLRSIKLKPIGPDDYRDGPDIVGWRRFTAVRTKVYCGDICPQYSLRIVDFVVEPADCARAGGVFVSIISSGTGCNPACIPKVLIPLTGVCSPL